MVWKQRCDVCQRPDILDFHVPDDIWESIVTTPYQNKVVCLNCFDKFASRKRIHYVDSLKKEMFFAGEMGCLILNIVSDNEPEI